MLPRSFAVAAALALALLPMQVRGADAEVQAEVPAGKTRLLRLRDLPANASVGLRVETSGPMRVIFVHQKGLQRSADRPRPLFSGAAERKLAFRISIPVAGTYFVVLDNRKGSEAREARVFIDVRRARSPKPAPQRPPQPLPKPGLEAT